MNWVRKRKMSSNFLFRYFCALKIYVWWAFEISSHARTHRRKQRIAFMLVQNDAKSCSCIHAQPQFLWLKFVYLIIMKILHHITYMITITIRFVSIPFYFTFNLIHLLTRWLWSCAKCSHTHHTFLALSRWHISIKFITNAIFIAIAHAILAEKNQQINEVSKKAEEERERIKRQQIDLKTSKPTLIQTCTRRAHGLGQLNGFLVHLSLELRNMFSFLSTGLEVSSVYKVWHHICMLVCSLTPSVHSPQPFGSLTHIYKWHAWMVNERTEQNRTASQ